MKNKIIVESDDMFSEEDTENIEDIENKKSEQCHNKISVINSTNIENDFDTDFEKQCDLLLNKITANYKEQRNEIRNLVKLHKKEIRNIKGNKRAKSTNNKNGFTKPNVVPDKLADFVGIDKGTEMARTELTKLIFQEFQRRNLYHKKDRRIIIPDNDVIKLFNLSEESQKSNNPRDKNGLNIFSIQKYITQLYNETNKQNDNKQNNNKQNDNLSIYKKNFDQI